MLQEVLAAAFNAILADDRPINVRPWLYRIARNRSLNHLRRIQAVGVDSMDVHLSENGATTADKVHEREEFRMLVGDIHELPETQRTALVLREMDALSYEQIAEAMETTVPSVKSLLVRARVSLAEAAEARLLSCDEVRIELGEVAEGLRRRPSPLVRRHLRSCKRCASFQRPAQARPTRRSPRCCRSARWCRAAQARARPSRPLRRRGRRRRRHGRRRRRRGGRYRSGRAPGRPPRSARPAASCRPASARSRRRPPPAWPPPRSSPRARSRCPSARRPPRSPPPITTRS